MMEEKFECKKQEVVDPHTGTTLTFGRHENGHAWMRIAVSNPANLGIDAVTKTTTVVFCSDGSVMRVIPHNVSMVIDFDVPPPLFNELTAMLPDIPATTPVEESKQAKQAKEDNLPVTPKKYSPSHTEHGRK